MKGVLHRIGEDIGGSRSEPLFLRALLFTALYDLEQLLTKHAEFSRLYPDEKR